MRNWHMTSLLLLWCLIGFGCRTEKPEESAERLLVERKNEPKLTQPGGTESRLGQADRDVGPALERGASHKREERRNNPGKQQSPSESDEARKAKVLDAPAGEHIGERAGCSRQCAGKSCGEDGCGGTCGTCKRPAACVDGECEMPAATRIPVTMAASDWNYRASKPSRYHPDNTVDENLATAWCKENGTGEWLRLSVGRNGYQKWSSDKYGDRFSRNSRVKTATLRFSEGSEWSITLDDTKEWQEFDLQWVYSDSVVLNLTAGYWGEDKSLCVSELEVYGIQ